jgi:hypothetical protein
MLTLCNIVTLRDFLRILIKFVVSLLLSRHRRRRRRFIHNEGGL